MIYCLGDFELQKGDWVKLSHSGQWVELRDMFEYKGSGLQYNFYETGGYGPHATVRGVLRPNKIMREKLDEILEAIPNARFGPQIRKEIDFIIVEPRKPKEEPKKSLIEKCAYEMARYNEPKVLNALMPLCDKLEALEKKLEEAQAMIDAFLIDNGKKSEAVKLFETWGDGKK